MGKGYLATARLVSILARLFVAVNLAQTHWQLHSAPVSAKTCNVPAAFIITDADILFNSSEAWDVYSGSLRFDGDSEFERVALHELGHALGLNHSSANSAIMRAFVSDTDSLQSDDIAGIASIYGEERDGVRRLLLRTSTALHSWLRTMQLSQDQTTAAHSAAR